MAYRTVGTPDNTTIINVISVRRTEHRGTNGDFAGINVPAGTIVIRVGVWSGHHAELLDDVSYDATVKADLWVQQVIVNES